MQKNYMSRRIGKKAIAGIVTASVLCAAAFVPLRIFPCCNAANTVSASGDLNGDGSVNSTDVKILQEALLHQITLSKEQFTAADVVADGKINGEDLAKLRQIAAGTDPLSDCIQIHLSDSGIQVENDTKGVTSISDQTVTISAAGVYLIDGSITDGQVLVDSADTEDVELYIQDVTMTSSSGAPCIYGKTASKIKMTCGGTNTFMDTAAAANADISGVIAAECDLTITKNSTGSLNITSSMNRGIFCQDDLKLNGGTIEVVTSVDDTSDADAIRANNTLEVNGATVIMDSSADGLKSNKEDVVITSGKVEIKAGNDAIQAVTEIAVSGGTVVASGDRGLTLDDGGALCITGGSVIATATDYAFGQDKTGTTLNINTTGSTQGIMQLSYAEEWKKNNAITLKNGNSTVLELTPVKKFGYVLLSSSGIDTSAAYQLYTGGTQMTHSGSTTGEFKMNGNSTSFTEVKALENGSSITPGEGAAASLVYSSGSVKAYNESGEEVASPSNVTISGTTATVITSTEISVSGECSNGQLIVDVDKTAEPAGKVTLNLAGLTLSNPTAAPIYVAAIGDEVEISAKNGTTNTISDGTSHTDTYLNSDGSTETINGAIFSRDDLKLEGKGTLIVNGNTEDGIVCKNDLKIWNGNITVTAQDDGIRGNDSVRIGDPDDTDYSALMVTVKTNNGSYGGDGIKATSTDNGKGYVTMNGGTVHINSYADGIQAEQTFIMNGGDVTIETYTGAGTVSDSSNDFNNPWGGGMGQEGNTNYTDVSAKGIKAVGLYDSTGITWQSNGDIMINGGTLTVDSTDDCLHTGGNIDLAGGELTLSSGDDAVHADHDLTIGHGSNTFDDLSVMVLSCYEGMEALNITQNSGSVIVNSTDDGYNAAGGSDGSGNGNIGGGWGQGGFGGMGGSTNSGSYSLSLKGGFALVNASEGDHDGFDSNGTLTISGGYWITNGNEPFDCDGNLSCTGGVWVSNCGNTMSMGNELSATATASGNVRANTRVSVVDGNGNVIVSWIADKSVSTCKAGGDVSSDVTFQIGGTLSGSSYFQQFDQTQLAAYGGTLSGGTALTAGSGSGNTGGWGGRSYSSDGDIAVGGGGFSVYGNGAPGGGRSGFYGW